jgi:hypothetical protein
MRTTFLVGTALAYITPTHQAFYRRLMRLVDDDEEVEDGGKLTRSRLS